MTISNETMVSGVYAYAPATDKAQAAEAVTAVKNNDRMEQAVQYTATDVVRGGLLGLAATSDIQRAVSQIRTSGRSNGNYTEIMQKMNALAAQSMRGNLDANERKNIKSDMMELKSILVEMQNSESAMNAYNSLDVARRLNNIDVADFDVATSVEDALSMVTSSMMNIISQASQAIQAQANQSNQGVLSLCTN